MNYECKHNCFCALVNRDCFSWLLSVSVQLICRPSVVTWQRYKERAGCSLWYIRGTSVIQRYELYLSHLFKYTFDHFVTVWLFMLVFILSFMPLISLNIVSPILHLPLKDLKMYTLVIPYVLSVLFYVSKSNVKDIYTQKMVCKSCLRSVHVPYLTLPVFEWICFIPFLCGLQLWNWVFVLEFLLHFNFFFFFFCAMAKEVLKILHPSSVHESAK